MKVVVLNGSPKGAIGVTHQYTAFLERVFPEHELVTIPVAQRIREISRDPAERRKVLEEVAAADGVLWAFPLYILLVSSQYKRFIELVLEEGRECFRGKAAAALSTSINFFDSNALTYVRGACEDLGMRFIDSYSARMYDLTQDGERRRLAAFGRAFFDAIRDDAQPMRLSAVLPREASPRYLPALPVRVHALEGKKAVIVTDQGDSTGNLAAMAQRLNECWGGEAEIISLHELDIKGGCQGCLRCGAESRCAWDGKDGFRAFYEGTLKPADILVFAGTVCARQLSWKWREFFDRSFFSTHTPSLTGKQIAFLVEGPLALLPELRETYEAWVEFQRSHLAAWVSDEAGTAEVLDRALDDLAGRLVRLSRAAYIRPRTFRGVAGMKVFRDDIWGGLRVVFRADHKAYRRLGVYDFPQRSLRRRVTTGLAWIATGLPLIRGRFPGMIRTRMADPVRRAAEQAVIMSDP
jgi:multimeric flavodoxin WrbA